MNNLNVVSEQRCDISDARLKFRVRSHQPPNYQTHTDKPRKRGVCVSVNLWDYRVCSLSHTNSGEESEKTVVGCSVPRLQQLRLNVIGVRFKIGYGNSIFFPVK